MHCGSESRAMRCKGLLRTGDDKVQVEGALEGLSFTPSPSSRQNPLSCLFSPSTCPFYSFSSTWFFSTSTFWLLSVESNLLDIYRYFTTFLYQISKMCLTAFEQIRIEVCWEDFHMVHKVFEPQCRHVSDWCSASSQTQLGLENLELCNFSSRRNLWHWEL